MDTIPQSVDIRRLAGPLKVAKQVMKKVETKDFSTGNFNASSFSHDGTQLVDESHVVQIGGQVGHSKEEVIPFKNLKTSKMPDFIKQAMVENQIPVPTMQGGTFNLEDVEDLIEKPMPVPQPKTNHRKQVTEGSIQHTNDTFTVSESVLRGIVKDVLIEYLSGEYSKKLSETVVENTIKSLLKEHRLVKKTPTK